MRSTIRLINILALSLPLMLAALPANAADHERPYMKDVARFFELLAEDRATAAVESIYASSPYAETIAQDMDNVAFQLESLGRVHGKYRAHEILVHKVVAERFAYLMFFVAYDRQPFKMEVQFYRPEDEWFFLGYSFTDGLANDLAEAAQFKLLGDYP